MTEEELLALCGDVTYKGPSESAECYGIGRHMREYGFYPQWLPVCVATDHGPSQRDEPTILEFQDRAPVMLYHSKRLMLQWCKKSDKPCYVMFSPFVFCRLKRHIQRMDSAKGTLAFPVHSTDLIENDYNIEEYIKTLLALPSEFQPVSACLYYLDIRKGRHKIFQNYGIPVFTAGHIYDRKFTERFYNILRNFAFATSNHFGSYVLYSVEMGLPFFIKGDRPSTINRGDPNCPADNYDPSQISRQYKKVSTIFEGIRSEITKEQKDLVDSELGIHDGVSRYKMAVILYSALIKWLFSAAFLTSLIGRVYKYIPEGMKGRIYLFRNKLSEEAKIVTHMVLDEKVSLHKLSNRLNSGSVVVEIGSYLGASSSFIASGIKNKGGTLYCIDTWENQTMPEGETNTYDEFIRNTDKYKYIIVPVRGWSSEVATAMKELINSIDLLLIDGDHSYEACRTDWESYSPLLKKGSIVVFHDTGWADGVNKVIAESVIQVADKILELPNMQAFKMREQVLEA